MTMRISEINNPDMFQNLVHALMTAKHGLDFQTVDDAAGDGGVDGYLCTNKAMFAIYCPERRPPASEYLRRKIRSDLDKAVQRRESGEYEIERWVFVTPMALTREISVLLTQAARNRGMHGLSMNGLHLEDLFERYPHIHSRFAELTIPNLRDDIARLEARAEANTEAILTAIREHHEDSLPAVPISIAISACRLALSRSWSTLCNAELQYARASRSSSLLSDETRMSISLWLII